MARYYRVVLINTETGERRLTYNTFTSRKKAIEWATEFCLSLKRNIGDFEVVSF